MRRPPLLLLDHVHASGHHGLGAAVRIAEELGAYPLPVPTCLCLGPAAAPERLHPLPWRLVRRMLDDALEREPVAAMIGLVPRKRAVRMLARALRENGPSASVVAPLSIAFDAARLLQRGTLEAVRRELVPDASVVMIAAEQVRHLVGGTADDSLQGMNKAGAELLECGARAAWLRAGSQKGRGVDLIIDRHGTGLLDYPPAPEGAEPHLAAAALSALLAIGSPLRNAIDRAHRHVYGFDRAAHRASR